MQLLPGRYVYRSDKKLEAPRDLLGQGRSTRSRRALGLLAASVDNLRSTFVAYLSAHPLRLLAFGLGVLAVAGSVVGCGGSRPTLPSSVGTRLTQESDLVAAKLKQGDACGAAYAATTLKRSAAEAIAAGQIPSALAVELRARTARLASAIACVSLGAAPSPAPTAVAPTNASNFDGKGHGKGEGKGYGKGNGDGKGHGGDGGDGGGG
jgi:hypothetical protein